MLPKEEIALLAHDICELMDERGATDLGSMMMALALVLPSRALGPIQHEDRFQRYLTDLMHIALNNFSEAQAALGKRGPG